MRAFELGDRVIDVEGSAWTVIGICRYPTVTFEKADGTERVTHAEGCLNLLSQFPRREPSTDGTGSENQ